MIFVGEMCVRGGPHLSIALRWHRASPFSLMFFLPDA